MLTDKEHLTKSWEYPSCGNLDKSRKSLFMDIHAQ